MRFFPEHDLLLELHVKRCCHIELLQVPIMGGGEVNRARKDSKQAVGQFSCRNRRHIVGRSLFQRSKLCSVRFVPASLSLRLYTSLGTLAVG